MVFVHYLFHPQFRVFPCIMAQKVLSACSCPSLICRGLLFCLSISPKQTLCFWVLRIGLSPLSYPLSAVGPSRHFNPSFKCIRFVLFPSPASWVFTNALGHRVFFSPSKSLNPLFHRITGEHDCAFAPVPLFLQTCMIRDILLVLLYEYTRSFAEKNPMMNASSLCACIIKGFSIPLPDYSRSLAIH